MSGGLPRRWIALGLILGLGSGLLWSQPPPLPPDAPTAPPPATKPAPPPDAFPLPPLDPVPPATKPAAPPPPVKPMTPVDAFPLPPLDTMPVKPTNPPPIFPVTNPPVNPLPTQPTFQPNDPPKPTKPTVIEVKPTGTAPATIIVEVPANATIWIEDQRMTQTGPIRSFQSPPLVPGKTYMYKFRLQWPSASGQPFNTEHEITLAAGQTQRIDFRPLASGTIGPTTYPMQPPPITYPRPVFPRVEGSYYQ
jgi:uncharacterized protein (TIGR03000 family)